MARVIARTEFAAAVSQLAKERGLDPDVVLETLESAIVAAFEKDATESGIELDETRTYKVSVDPGSGSVRIVSVDAETGGDEKDETPPGFGRIATQTAKQVIIQKIREAERSAVLATYTDKVGTIMNGMILRFDGPRIIVDLGKAQAVMPSQEQVQSEKYELNQRMAFYIQAIRDGIRGREIIVSRADKQLVSLLFKREVPEVNSGSVEIKAIAREAGGRTKLAVHSTQQGVDPVGSCVGQKGVRVQAVIDELKGEKIDIIEYSDDLVRYIAAAMSPATVEGVKVDEENESAVVTVPDDQLSLAIGKNGENVRLAAKLTEYKIDVVGASGIKPDSAPRDEDRVVETAEEGEEVATTSEFEEAGLSARTIKALEAANITSMEELAAKKDSLKEIEGIGPKSRQEIEAALESK